MEKGRLDRFPTGPVHLDTVRSLHQTVVSLRTALETSKSELQELKQKYQRHSHCIEYEDIIEKLTLENHILRRKIIDSGSLEDQNILEVSYEPRIDDIRGYSESDVVIKSASTGSHGTEKEQRTGDRRKSTENLEDIREESKSESAASENATGSVQDVPKDPVPESKGNSVTSPSFKTKLELLSKFDVRIKVKTLKDGSVISSTTSDSESTDEKKTDKTSTDAEVEFSEHREHFEDFKNKQGDTVNLTTASSENIKMAVPNEAEVKSKTDKFDVQVRITSEDSLVVKEGINRDKKKDTMNLDVDNLSLRSLSEGDNSVFYEGGTTPQDPNTAPDYKQEQENASGNESEEVDDIELIFTTDESKDISNLQEDLVSIQETDNWTPALSSSAHSTPVLIKFHTLDPDFQPGRKAGTRPEIRDRSFQRTATESSLRMKRVSLPNDKDIRHVGFKEKGTLEPPGRGILKSYDNRSDNMLYRRSPNASNRRLDSVDSLTSEYRGMSFDTTKSSSFELGSSLDVLHRDESVSNYNRNRMGHRYSVFAATDISKCGTSQDDLESNLNIRRNTCPNPFQYGLSRGLRGRKPVRTRLLHQGFAPRRESAAQTDMSALPPRWTSDGYLAYKTCVTPGVAPTLPQKAAPRRPLLSDIGFTSMVPELSRSAEPLWVRRVPPSPGVPSVCPSTLHPSHGLEPPRSPLLRYRYRSPNISVERTNEWTPPTYATPKGVWRGSLPDVRHDDTDELLRDTEAYLRRSIDNLRSSSLEAVNTKDTPGHPYIPSEPRHLRLGHAVKVITTTGRLAMGRVRYVGLAGGTAANSSIVVGAEFALNQYPGIPLNDGTYNGRKYFVPQPHHTAMFVPFSKVVMAWMN